VRVVHVSYVEPGDAPRRFRVVYHFNTFADFKAALSEARADALAQAREDWTYPCIYDRQREILTGNAEGRCAEPAYESITFRNMRGVLDETLPLVYQGAPCPVEICVWGGFDGAASVFDRMSGDYAPIIGEYEVTWCSIAEVSPATPETEGTNNVRGH
jgi:hypothetical protein